MTGAGLDSEDQQLLLGVIRSLGRRLVTPAARLRWDRDGGIPESILRKLLEPELGLHLALLPAECGGLGAGALDLSRVCEALARLDLGLATTLLGVALGCEPIRVGGTAEQRRRWLGRVAREGLLVAYAVTEPGAGSDVASIATVAEPVEGGAAYRLRGTKQFITNGSTADLYTVLARTPGGPAFFVVPRSTAGVEPGRPERKHGVRCSDTAQVSLDLTVPAEDLVGLVEGLGLAQARATFAYTRLMVAAFGLGAGQEALDRAVAYAGQRRQFGKPLWQHRGYADRLLLPHAAALEASRALIEQVARRLDAGQDAAALATEAAMAKVLATEAGNAAADAAMQAHGGYGYVRDYLVEKIRRDVRVTTIYEGTSEILLALIFVNRLKQVVRSQGACYTDAAPALAALGPAVAGDLAARCQLALGALLPALHRLKVSQPQDARLRLAQQMSAVEQAATLCRAAAHAGPGLQAASRIYCAQVAGQLGQQSLRLLSTAGLDSAVARDLRHQADLDALLTSPHGGPVDQDQLLSWLMERSST